MITIIRKHDKKQFIFDSELAFRDWLSEQPKNTKVKRLNPGKPSRKRYDVRALRYTDDCTAVLHSKRVFKQH